MPNAPPMLIGVVPMGAVPLTAAQVVAAHISGHLNLDVEILPPLAHPDKAYNPNRDQYNAAMILKDLEARRFDACFKIMALVNVDLFVPIFEYVFGEAKVGGKCALVSLFRLFQNPEGPPPPPALAFERAAKVALHELSHLFNLLHCEDRRCLMHFCGGVPALDQTPFLFCRYCSRYIRDYREQALKGS